MQNPISSLCITMILRLMKCIWPTPVTGNCISMVSPVWLVLNMCFVGASNFLFLGSSWQYCLTMISLSFESYETTTSRFWLLRKLHVSISDIRIKKRATKNTFIHENQVSYQVISMVPRFFSHLSTSALWIQPSEARLFVTALPATLRGNDTGAHIPGSAWQWITGDPTEMPQVDRIW